MFAPVNPLVLRSAATALTLVALMGAAASARAPGGVDPEVANYNYVLGTQTFGANYKFTDEPRDIETARRISEMGSNILKYQVESIDDVYAMNDAIAFKYSFLWYRSSSESWRNGMSEDARDYEYEQTYDFTKALLERYDGTGKVFFIGHWEGDWYLIPNYDPSKLPSPESFEGMIDWYNVRQKAIDDAKRDVRHGDVQVYQYAEVCRVRDALVEGKPRLVNKVLPYVNVDYVSYSSYDMQRLSQKEINRTLDYVQSMMKEKPGLPGKRVFIGEMGIAAKESGYADAAHERTNRAIFLKFLEWGCPFILYWEMYNNEVVNGKDTGFWLIDDKNTKWKLYHTLEGLYANARTYVADYKNANGKVPPQDDYLRWAMDYLKKR